MRVFHSMSSVPFKQHLMFIFLNVHFFFSFCKYLIDDPGSKIISQFQIAFSFIIFTSQTKYPQHTIHRQLRPYSTTEKNAPLSHRDNNKDKSSSMTQTQVRPQTTALSLCPSEIYRLTWAHQVPVAPPTLLKLLLMISLVLFDVL